LLAEGQAAASAVNEAAEALVDSHRRWTHIASEISATVYSGGIAVKPGLVSASKADTIARDAAALLLSGGEEGPRLRRDPRPPRVEEPVEETSAA
jgi:hypothetical protein